MSWVENVIMSNDERKIIPQFRDLTPTLETDICVWCGKPGPLSKSHLFPEKMGGWFAPFISCDNCNHFLGSKYESDFKKNAFFAAARVKLELASKKDAYQFAKKTDSQTGLEMKFINNDNAKVVSKKIDDNHFTGDNSDSSKFWTKKLKKERPLWPDKPLKDFLNKQKNGNFKYAGQNYCMNIRPTQKNEMNLQMERDPSPKLLFKIIYEWVAMNGWLRIDKIYNFFGSFITINTNDPQNRIIISDDINKYSLFNTVNTFRRIKSPETIEFADFHVITICVTPKQNLYFEVAFFGQIRCFFIVDTKLTPAEIIRLDPYNTIGFFTSSNTIFQEHGQFIEVKDHYTWADVAVDVRLWEIHKDKE